MNENTENLDLTPEEKWDKFILYKIDEYECTINGESNPPRLVKPNPGIYGRNPFQPFPLRKVVSYWKVMKRSDKSQEDSWVDRFYREHNIPEFIHLIKMTSSMQYWLWMIHRKYVAFPKMHRGEALIRGIHQMQLRMKGIYYRTLGEAFADYPLVDKEGPWTLQQWFDKMEGMV